MDNRVIIESGRTALGIEFGSTRIKAVLTDPDGSVLATGFHDWENSLEDGMWTYPLEEIHEGLRNCYAGLREDVREKYGCELTRIGAIGISAMMHGYMAFDKAGSLLVPFRTWRNSNTQQAADALTELFDFNIPLRWTISHLYQCILNKEPHVKNIEFVTTLDSYITWKLTGEKNTGVGDASGIFPIDSETRDYDAKMMDAFEKLIAPCGFPWKTREVLPKVLVAGEIAGRLTAEGAAFLDPSGTLVAGTPVAPSEGDAGTGMVATNSVAPRSNVSGVDREKKLFVIKPSGVPYEDLKPTDMVVVDFDGNKVEGEMNPSSDTATHAWLYKCFETIGGIVHTHSSFATSWAQAGRDIPCYGTTHADYYYGPVPCLRSLTAEEIDDAYELNTGKLIVEEFARMGKDPEAVSAVLCKNHGPFTWGRDPVDAVHSAVVLEEVAKMAFRTELINPEVRPAPQILQDKHYYRKHGANAYYGQGGSI